VNLYKQYILERENLILEHGDHWFFTWRKEGSTLFIGDLFVEASHRNKGLGTRLGELITDMAKTLNCSKIHAEVFTTAGHSNESLKSFINYGFKKANQEKDKIEIVKEI